jgi:hypothetical protein
MRKRRWEDGELVSSARPQKRLHRRTGALRDENSTRFFLARFISYVEYSGCEEGDHDGPRKAAGEEPSFNRSAHRAFGKRRCTTNDPLDLLSSLTSLHEAPALAACEGGGRKEVPREVVPCFASANYADRN